MGPPAAVVAATLACGYYIKNTNLLQHYQRDDDNQQLLTYSFYIGAPGERVVDNTIPFPSLDELRKLKVSKHNNSYILISWALIDYKNDGKNFYLSGVQANSFTHELGSNYKVISKTWRKNIYKRTTKVESFCDKVFNDINYPLANTIATLNYLPLGNEVKLTVQKIIVEGLYLGEVAYNYLTNVKKLNEDVVRQTMVPKCCIYTAYNFDPTYNQQNPKPHNNNLTLNYDQAFWFSPLSQAVWEECFNLLTQLSIDFEFNYWTDIYAMLDSFKHKANNTQTNLLQVLKINLFIIGLHTIYCYYKYINDLYSKKLLEDYIIDNSIANIKIKFYDKVQSLIILTPQIHHKIYLKSTSSTGVQILNERERQLIPTYYADFDDLTDNEISLFELTWNRTDLLEIEGKKLKLKPYRYDPP